VTNALSLPFDETPRPQRPSRRVVTVSELTRKIRSLLETAHDQVWIEGELANCRAWKTGHLYFTLRDEHAQLKAVMFRSAVRYLRFTAEDGLRVIARGRVTVYEPKGEYQIVCEHLQPKGLGDLQVAFDQLKHKLDSEGLLATERKRALPVLPRQIGVVTSLDGAVLRDILQVLGRRHHSAQVVIRPVRVQGEGAADEIARGVSQLARQENIDVIIVARGGGSLEDLWAFNEEPVARAIVTSQVPIISAVGHETDVTISDMVADVRAPTPSAAAEIVVAGRHELVNRINRSLERLHGRLQDQVRRLRTRLLELGRHPAFVGWPARLAVQARVSAELTHALDTRARASLTRRERRIREMRLRLEACEPSRWLESMRTRLVAADGRLKNAARQRGDRAHAHTRNLAGQLNALSPLGVLGRGYAVCWHGEHGVIVRDATALTAGDPVTITLHRGRVMARVTRTDAAPSK